MYEDYIKLYGTSLDIYERTKAKLVPFTVQIDLVSSMFETNDNSDEGESSGKGGFLVKCDLIKRLTTLTRKDAFDPKQQHDMVGLLLGLLMLVVEVSQDMSKGQ